MKQSRKLIITKWKQGILSMLLEDDIDMELHYDESSDIQVGNIYIAKVKDVVKNINAAFVEIMPDKKCYLSMEDVVHPIYLNRLHENTKASLIQGDEILVQITKEQMKTKDAVVSTNLSFAGRYVVISEGDGQIGVSAKINDEQRKDLRTEMRPYIPKDANVVIRTNAQYVSPDEIVSELQVLDEQRKNVVEKAKHRTCYSVMWRMPEGYLSLLRDLNMECLDEIVTDDMEIYQKTVEACGIRQKNCAMPHIQYYQDLLLPLMKLYSIESRLEKALNKRVWLKSGGYLVIEPTEALTAIDVNTGKYNGKKNQQDTFMKINLEAAKEIARQLRLRNLSGIVIVDFINMERKEDRDILMEKMKEFVKADRVKTQVHDMTELQLVEITRKKTDRSLYEVMDFHG